MSEITCFLVVDTGRDRLYLRRFIYSDGKGCSHDASVAIGETTVSEAIRSSDRPPADYENDPRWPTKCDKCAYVFSSTDQWQLFRRSIYRREETGEEWPHDELPAGAMYDATWYHGLVGRVVGPDGMALHVVCPPGGSWGDHWHVDGPANNGPGWERTGVVPRISASPSIQTPRYHGHLRDGKLIPC